MTPEMTPKWHRTAIPRPLVDIPRALVDISRALVDSVGQGLRRHDFLFGVGHDYSLRSQIKIIPGRPGRPNLKEKSCWAGRAGPAPKNNHAGPAGPAQPQKKIMLGRLGRANLKRKSCWAGRPGQSQKKHTRPAGPDSPPAGRPAWLASPTRTCTENQPKA